MTGTCAVTTMISSTDKPGKTEKLVTLGPTGQLVLSAKSKKQYNVSVLRDSKRVLDLDGTCIATLHEMATGSRNTTPKHRVPAPGMP